ncbi:MAG: glycosyltransferase family 2 protein [Candidatus Thorarchaeota archaeon]
MKISIVIPTYNSIKFINACLDSVLAQTYEDREVIVYDNESIDGTYELLESRLDENFKLISIPNTEPNGYREAIRHIFKNSTSEFVTFISSDDFIDKNYIKNYLNFIETLPDKYKLYQSGLIYATEQGIHTDQRVIHTYTNLEEFKALCLKHCPVANPTVVYRTEVGPLLEIREAHKAYNVQDIGAGDYDMWCGLADRGVFIKPINECFGYFYRWHSDQCTWKIRGQPINHDAIIQAYWRNKWLKN